MFMTTCPKVLLQYKIKFNTIRPDFTRLLVLEVSRKRGCRRMHLNQRKLKRKARDRKKPKMKREGSTNSLPPLSPLLIMTLTIPVITMNEDGGRKLLDDLLTFLIPFPCSPYPRLTFEVTLLWAITTFRYIKQIRSGQCSSCMPSEANSLSRKNRQV